VKRQRGEKRRLGETADKKKNKSVIRRQEDKRPDEHGSAVLSVICSVTQTRLKAEAFENVTNGSRSPTN